MNKDYGNWWNKHPTSEWYREIFNKHRSMHDLFKHWCDENQPESVLEVGCGDGIYGKFFNRIPYTGIDFSQKSIDLAEDDNQKHRYISGDFLKMVLNEKFDLVFAHHVIDHIYDIEKFVDSIVAHSSRLYWITAYNGYHPDIENHIMEWNHAVTCYVSKISAKAIKRQLPGAEVFGIKAFERSSTIIRGTVSEQ
jgi:SAM-dependent methyltransferase